MNFKLTLTTRDGAVLEQWNLSTDDMNDTADVSLPVRGLGVQWLIRMLNDAAVRYQQSNPAQEEA